MSTGTLLLAGRRVAIPDGGLTIGRAETNDVVLDSELVSREHARIDVVGDRCELVDLGSANGTYVDGRPIDGVRRALRSGDCIEIGEERLRFVTGDATAVEPAPVTQVHAGAVRLEGARLTIGRDAANDLVLADPNVSRFHAELVAGDGGVELRDLGSRNGTRLDGEPVRHAPLRSGAEIGIGPFRLTFDGESLLTRDERGAVCLVADEVSVEADGREILAPTSLAIEPGRLVGMIGSSGSGKTTLLRTLAGVSRPTSGEVRINGEPLAARLTDVGYVPQHEIVHGRLTPREALRYSARLRLPPDAGRDEVEDAVERTLAELSLTDLAGRPIDTLSGGERRRAGVAVELLGRPSVLFLDEPTTGLDPDLEVQLMRLLRDLADGSRAVVVVTHATRSLELCDELVVVGPGGHLHFHGPPREALTHFGVSDYDSIYERVAAAPAPPPPQAAPAELPQPRRRRRPARRGVAAHRQFAVLARRHARVLSRDRRNLAILLAQAPILGAAIGALFGSDLFQRNRHGNPNDAAQVLFLLVTTAIWLGAISAAREIVKERAVVARERAIGVGLGTYVLSKAAVLWALAVVQTGLLFGVAAVLRPFHAGAPVYATAGVELAGTALVAVALGLLISASARSSDQATSLIPLALLPQLLFAGAIVPVSKMGGVIEKVSDLVFARWSFAAVGRALDMNGRLRHDPADAGHSPYGHHFFTVSKVEIAGLLAAFLVTFLAAATGVLRRRTRS